MKLNWILAVFLALTVFVSQPVEAKRLTLRPMSASEVYRVLREAGREDAIPEGRVITQGISAIKGFAVGLTKGIGGTMLFNLANSNATSQFLNNINYTALMGGYNISALKPTINYTALYDMSALYALRPTINYTALYDMSAFTALKPTINYTALYNMSAFSALKPTINYTALYNMSAFSALKPTINYTALYSMPFFNISALKPNINYTALFGANGANLGFFGANGGLFGLAASSANSTTSGSSANTIIAANSIKFDKILTKTPKIITQEICFVSRSVDEINDEQDEAMGRQVTGTETMLTSPATTAASAPSMGDIDTGTNTDTGDATYTNIDTITQTGNSGAINCIVIQKPAQPRKRRSSRRARRTKGAKN